MMVVPRKVCAPTPVARMHRRNCWGFSPTKHSGAGARSTLWTATQSRACSPQSVEMRTWGKPHPLSLSCSQCPRCQGSQDTVAWSSPDAIVRTGKGPPSREEWNLDLEAPARAVSSALVSLLCVVRTCVGDRAQAKQVSSSRRVCSQ